MIWFVLPDYPLPFGLGPLWPIDQHCYTLYQCVHLVHVSEWHLWCLQNINCTYSNPYNSFNSSSICPALLPHCVIEPLANRKLQSFLRTLRIFNIHVVQHDSINHDAAALFALIEGKIDIIHYLVKCLSVNFK